jgi:hypothetical protein
VLDLSVDGNIANASKDRTRLFRDPCVITEDTGIKLKNWLNSGEAVKEMGAPKPVVSPPTPLQQTTNDDPVFRSFCEALQRRGLWAAEAGEARSRELSDFFGREIKSPRELSREEMAEYAEANQPTI